MSGKITEMRKAQIDEKMREITELSAELKRLQEFGDQLSRESTELMSSSSTTVKLRRKKQDGLTIKERLALNEQQREAVTQALSKLQEEKDALSEV
ncbi:MAG: hypothetical protein M1825_003525 [Sarcosagium campestre]|nr:MAG: hypothetical protein M1825_003525 [Sarcosagium campestre]